MTERYDLVGDVHGCAAELDELLTALGYDETGHPEGRVAVFVGDLVDRGPDTPGVLRRVMRLHTHDAALAVQGNHEAKLVRALGGAQVRTSHGLQASLDQLAQEGAEFREQVRTWLADLPYRLLLDEDGLVVAHAGLREELHHRGGSEVRATALYGETTGRRDDLGYPERLPWQRDYRGEAVVVYGHTPVSAAEWVGNTICLDTGCVFGGRLTALRWPERELVDVPAHRAYASPARPLAPVVR